MLDNKKLTDLENNAYLRLGTIVTGAVFCISASFLVGGWMTGIGNKIDNLQMQMTELRESVSQRTADRWRKSDMDNWCRETELANHQWHCGKVEGRQ